MSFAELLALLASASSVLVFIGGFLSLRIHAHNDAVRQVYETLLDRAIDLSTRTSSYPRPSEFVRIKSVYVRSQQQLDGGTIKATIAVCIIAWSIAVGDAAYAIATKSSGFTGWQLTALALDVLLLSGVLVVVLRDVIWVFAELNSQGSRTLPGKYERGVHLFKEGRYGPALEEFQDIIEEIPRWPWALFWAARTYRELGNYPRAASLARLMQTEVSTGAIEKDSVDSVLRSAALKFWGNKEPLPPTDTLQALIAATPELQDVVDWVQHVDRGARLSEIEK